MRSRIGFKEPYKVCGAERGPDLPEKVSVDESFQAPANVARGKTGPNHIGEIAGYVIENARMDIRIVSKRQIGDTRSYTGAHNPDLPVALFLEPLNNLSHFQNCLPGRMKGAS